MAYFDRVPQVLIFGLTATIVMTSFTSAIAAYEPGPGRLPKNTTITGTRDACNTGALIVTPLEPKTHIPEFGRNSDQPIAIPIVVSIANPQAATELNLKVNVYRFDKQSQRLAATVSAKQIAPNRWVAMFDQPIDAGQYSWKLFNNCKDQRTPITPIISVSQDFEVSDLPAGVRQSIAQAKSPEERSAIYAEAGFWYNAMAEALQSKESKTLTDLLAELERN